MIIGFEAMGKSSLGSRKQPEKGKKNKETAEKKKKPVKQDVNKKRPKEGKKKRAPSSSSVVEPSSSSSSSESEIDDQWVLQTEQVAGTMGLILGSIHIVIWFVCSRS